MAGSSRRHLALMVAVATGLSGCANMPNPFAGKGNVADTPPAPEAATSVHLVDHDVEAPETFQATDTALWDGRPSLGGVWVASPDAVNPERVILRNEANGKFVIGALFRRERDNPGPKLQISSDAADALGMLAGQPGKLNVTALRREDSKPDGAAVAAKAAAPAAAQLGDVETPAADPIAAASAAIDRADGTKPADGAGAADGTDMAAIAPAPQDDLDPTPRAGETKRAARRRARLAAKAAATTEVAAPALEGTAATAAPVPALEVAPLPDAAPAGSKEKSAVKPAIAPAGGSARVQIGIFSVEENAQRAVDKLKAGGVAATLRKEDSNGKPFWSVIANGSGDSKSLLVKIKGLGFGDAYAISK